MKYFTYQLLLVASIAGNAAAGEPGSGRAGDGGRRDGDGGGGGNPPPPPPPDDGGGGGGGGDGLDECLALDSTQNRVDRVIAIGAARDEAGVMYLPVNLGGSEALNDLLTGTMDVYESFEWFANVVPSEFSLANAEVVEGLPPSTSEQLDPFLNNQETAAEWGYKKWLAADPWWLLFIGMRADEATSGNVRNTLFTKNLQDRGATAAKTDENLMKMQYMSALTCDKLPLYEEKIDRALNRFLEDIQVRNKAVLGSWSRRSLELFFDFHFEGNDHPQFLVDWVETFISLQAPGSTSYVEANQEKLKRAHCLTGEVREYVEERRRFVIQNRRKENFLYHWSQAGLPHDAMVAEIVHNMLAWGQYVNILFLVLRAKLEGLVGLERLPEGQVTLDPIDFIEKLNDAVSYEEKMDAARETFRMLLPVGGWLSNFHDLSGIDDTTPLSDANANLQVSVHSPLYIQAMNDNYNKASGGSNFANYNTARYENSRATQCPHLNAVDITNPHDFFEKSSIDGETIVPKSHPEHYPIFNHGADSASDDTVEFVNGMKYCPFGAGYRRCPAELFNIFMVQKLLESLNTINFETADDLFESITPTSSNFDDTVPMGKARARDGIFAVVM